VWASRKQDRIVILVVGEEQSVVLDQAATGADRPLTVLTNKEQAWVATIFRPN